MSQPILFYDLPSNAAPGESVAWNPNTWKTRLTLNIKGVPYKTVWVEYPDIEAVATKHGAVAVEKRADGSPLYTLPMIFDPNTERAVVDSANIVRYLDRTYPDTPRLVPRETDVLHAAFQRAFVATAYAIPETFALLLPAANRRLNPRSEAYFRRTREAQLGVRFEEMAPEGSEKRKECWAGMKAAWHAVAGWYEANGEDEEERVLVMGGKSVSYADVTLAAFLIFVRIVLGEKSEEWQDLLTWDEGRWSALVFVFKRWEQVDDGSLAEQ